MANTVYCQGSSSLTEKSRSMYSCEGGRRGRGGKGGEGEGKGKCSAGDRLPPSLEPLVYKHGAAAASAAAVEAIK